MNEANPRTYLKQHLPEADFPEALVPGLKKIDIETSALTLVLERVNSQIYAKEVFQQVLVEIDKEIENFGFERFEKCFLFVNQAIISGQVELNSLTDNLQRFMHAAFYCLNRLAEHQSNKWKELKQQIDFKRKVQMIQSHGEDVIQIYQDSVASLGNPPISFEIMKTVLDAMLMNLIVAFSYKFSRSGNYQTTYDQTIAGLKTGIAEYIQLLLNNQSKKVSQP